MATKNTCLASAILLVIVPLAFFRAPSVAQLRTAARSPAKNVVITKQKTTPIAIKKPIRIQAPAAALVITRGTAYHSAPVITQHLRSLIDVPGMQPQHRRMSEQVLSLLTPACQNKLESYTVLYNNPQHRGLAGKGVVIVSGNVGDTEFMGLLLHEALGHFRDITCLTGTPGSGRSAFRDGEEPVFNDDPSAAFYSISWLNEKTKKPSARSEDFVTGYGEKADSFEDLAESVAYYVTQEDAFRLRAQSNAVLARKLAWLETYMPKSGRIAEGTGWNGQIAWDATKLSFAWIGK